MSDPVPIQYREIYDVPRMFIAVHDGVTFLFDSRFDDAIDDYADTYVVSTLPPLPPAELAGTWASLPSRAIRRLGSVPVAAVEFDATRRQFVDRALLRALACRVPAQATSLIVPNVAEV
jgi:hypothetical protein